MFCAKCGKQEFVNKEGNEFHCLACGFNYFHNVAAAVSAIIVNGGEMLATLRAKEPGLGKYDLPGGFVDPDESLEQALRRELKEELGVEFSIPKYLYSFANPYLYQGVLYQTVESVFEIRLHQKPDITIDTGEIGHYRWFSSDKIPLSQFAFNSSKAALTHYFNLDLSI